MIGKETKGNRAVGISEVLEIIKKRKSSPKGLSYEQQTAFEHASKFAADAADSDKLKKKLDDLGILNEKTIFKIIEIRPKNFMLLKQILASERKTFDDETVNKILALIKEKS
ncbi:MAG: hypothetical protein KGH60_00780 [Candidatus Micrarchaeota archaeon]|nr:hypothetical protein [Candidatus Micrarchaeota archaeon]